MRKTSCKYCGKEFGRKENCKRHEDTSCKKNPANAGKPARSEAAPRAKAAATVRAPAAPIADTVRIERVETPPPPPVVPGLEGLTDEYIKSLPTNESELQERETAKEEAAVSQATRERDLRMEQLRIKVSDRLNKFVGKLTTQPLAELAAKVAIARGQPALSPVEREYVDDAMDVLGALVGIEFDVQPWIWVVNNIFVAMAFALLVPVFVVFLRPGLSQEQKKTWREKMQGQKKEHAREEKK